MNEHLYVIGTVMAKEKAQENRKDGKANIPYNHQHKYWYVTRLTSSIITLGLVRQ